MQFPCEDFILLNKKPSKQPGPVCEGNYHASLITGYTNLGGSKYH